MPFSVSALLLSASFLYDQKMIMPLSFMPFSFTPLSGLEYNELIIFPFCLFHLCPFPFLPLPGLMEVAKYAGFIYANFRGH
jgi:hypothetical protein